MKLCKVAFENINSLAGKWSIDFESPQFDDGLFLITGDTGSGKTSILDAISLALYGRTVREKISKEQNEVMTRGRGTAMAEVEFVCEQGRFRARWEQQRAYCKATGSLQPVRMSLYDCVADRDIGEHRASDTFRMIEAKVGLSFEQFQRTMMLAQGKFDQFLSADEHDRSEILQQATGTEIYARVGDRIFQCKSEADCEVRTLKTKLDEAVTLEESVRSAMETECLAKRERQKVNAATLEAAEKLLADYLQKKQQADAASAELANRNQTAVRCDAEVVRANRGVADCEAAVKSAEANKAEKEPVIAQAIGLKQQLELDEQKHQSAEAVLATARASLRSKVDAETALKRTIATEKALAAMVTEALAGRFAAPADADAARDHLVDDAKDYVRRAESFAGKNEEIVRLKSEFDAASTACEETVAHYKDVHPGLQSAFVNAEKALELAKIVDKLETHRKHLEDGKACPLCGATEHPYARGNKPVKSECQLAYDAAKNDLKKIDDERNEALDRRQQKQTELRSAEDAFAEEKAAYEELKQNLERAQVTLSTQVTSNESRLTDAGAEIRNAEEEVRSRDADEKAALAKCAETRERLDALNLGKDPEILRGELQKALDEAKAASGVARATQATATANAQNARTEANAAQEKATEAVAAFQAVLTTIPDIAKHEASIGALKDEKKNLDDSLARIDERLKVDDEKIERRKELVAQLAEAETDKAKWTNLDKWLGGGGGEKFKLYAQGITLRHLLKAANPHLAAMTQNRYELVWEPKEGEAKKLLPSVVDKDQAGETRPVTNLSGGERFQVSLALALGLSAMSSNRIRVDSLFLDEGFGTLDSKTLEAALDTLCRIQQDGKLIGIISHVTEVGERIPTQIEVKKIGGGLSALSGAGVG